MTHAEIDAYRERFQFWAEEAMYMTYDHVEASNLGVWGLQVLAALDAKEAECGKLIKYNGELGLEKEVQKFRAYEAEEERDHWKKRAEALERALAMCMPKISLCNTCHHFFSDNAPCENCNDDYDLWAFDLARFMDGTVRDGGK